MSTTEAQTHAMSAVTPPASQWRPIETAPKDGRKILLAVNTGDTRLRVGSGHYSTDPYINSDGDTVGEEEGFKRDEDQCIPLNQERFVLWAPIPEPPPITEEAQP